MNRTKQTRGDTQAIVVWVILVALTVLSVGTFFGVNGETARAVLVFTLGFVKAGIVMWIYMEAKAAPFIVKSLAVGWTTVVWAIVAAMFIIG
ncbi:hypothetical protein A5674_22790 [Mycobacterium malmoense]|uniref:cytochrome C oxidase subunit IV family protein n=1 Tax=Mycobacterium malmoense TaxID=1780 RepID=UPI00080B969F|nr:cytochrome C oxidase subunit IV family protein [Mycobacterium malmoense]OCB24382.1 hypothetical protein A5674_22790 [Mycobacterium malmoense]